MSDLVAKLEDDARANRRGWRNFFILFGIVVIALGFYIFKDIDPPDDAWMLPKFNPVGQGKNPLEVFIDTIKTHPLQGWKDLSEKAQKFEKGQETAMHEFVQKNSKVSDAFDKLMQTDPATWCWPGIDDKCDFTTAMPGLSECQSVACQLQRMKIELLALDRKADEAAAEAAKIARYGQRLYKVEGPRILNLVAMKAQNAGESGMRTVITMPIAGESLLRYAHETLMLLDFSPNDLGVALRVDYLGMKNSLNAVKRGAVSIDEIAGFQGQFLNLFFRANRSLNIYFNTMRPIVLATEKVWAAVIYAANEQGKIIDTWRGDWRWYMNSNIGGNTLVTMGLPTIVTICVKGAENAALHRQAIIMIALRRFELEHGKLPDQLDELVPKFLDSVPTDPFDNAPPRCAGMPLTAWSIPSAKI